MIDRLIRRLRRDEVALSATVSERTERQVGAPTLGCMVEVAPPGTKVVFDKVVSLFVLLVTSPISLVICLASFAESAMSPPARGGLFHDEVRVSAGRPFTLYKFRILTKDGEQAIRDGAVPKHVENDPRYLTRIGWALKKVGFDELPQLISVLIGTMSLVGPRPKPIPEYEQEIERGNVFRAQLRAGLTGPTQAMKGTSRTGEEKVKAEFDYLELIRSGSRRQIAATDISTLFRTIRVVLGAYGE